MDPSSLTAAFRRFGYLEDQEVDGIELTQFVTNGIASEFYTAELSYAGESGGLPSRMVVKRPLVGDRGQGEANVYEHILRGERNLPVLACYAVLDEGEDKPLSLFFEDLSATHTQTEWPVIPSFGACQQAVTTLAAVHARWWGQAGFASAGVPPVARHMRPDHLASFFPDFVDFVGDTLSQDRRAAYESVFAGAQNLVNQRQSPANSALLHTDSHFWNFLYPRKTGGRGCVLFDWPLWNTGLAGCDLAYMIAQHLYPEHRQRFEPGLLAAYHESLTGAGVRYTLADVQHDYRIGIILGLLMPVMEFSWKIPPSDWLPKMEKGFGAFDDLNCRELLG